MAARRRWLYGLTANVVLLGVVSLFTDFSSEMILPILPFFIVQVLGGSAFIVGVIEGSADSVVAFMKVFSGFFSDRARRRKWFVAAGYGVSTVMKVLFPFAPSWPEFWGMRIVERTGKGVRDAPRDALITESTPPETRGKAFGFHRTMDTAGAIIGPLVALALLTWYLTGDTEGAAYRLIILVAALPAVASFSLVFLLKEPARETGAGRTLRITLRGIPRPLTQFIAIAALFSFADFSYAFLLLRVTDIGQTTSSAILLYVLFNVVYAAHAFPAGILSDRMGRKPVILTGYVCFVAMAVLLAWTPHVFTLILGFALYGLSYGMAEGTQRALVADIAPPESKATVLGAYHTSTGVVKLASGLAAGALWTLVAPAATFWFGAIVAGIAALALFLWKAPAMSGASGRAPPRPA